MRWRLIALGAVTYTLAMIVMLPATLADAALRDASSGRLRLAQAQGTLWSGKGQLEVRATDGYTELARHVAWCLRPMMLLRTQLFYEVEFGRASRSFPVTISWSRVELDNADFSLPAAVLGLGVPKLAPLKLVGDVQVRVSSLSIGRHDTHGSATLQWHAAGSSLTTVSPLGDYKLSLDAEGMSMHVILQTIKGPLRLDGEGSWTRGDRPIFQGMAYILPQYQQQLSPLLRLVAIERGEGQFELRLN